MADQPFPVGLTAHSMSVQERSEVMPRLVTHDTILHPWQDCFPIRDVDVLTKSLQITLPFVEGYADVRRPTSPQATSSRFSPQRGLHKDH